VDIQAVLAGGGGTGANSCKGTKSVVFFHSSFCSIFYEA
jgi:hypothetical protein